MRKEGEGRRVEIGDRNKRKEEGEKKEGGKRREERRERIEDLCLPQGWSYGCSEAPAKFADTIFSQCANAV